MDTHDGTTTKLYANGVLGSNKFIKGQFNTNDRPLLIDTRLNLPADTLQVKLFGKAETSVTFFDL